MPTYILRPYDLVGDWADVGGGLTGGLSDDNDATYKVFDNTYQYGEAKFNTGIIPWGSNIVIRTMKVRARHRTASGANAYATVQASTQYGRTLMYPGDGQQFAPVSTVFQETATGYRVVNLTQADGYVSVILHPTSMGTVPTTIYFSELYLDLEFNYPPIPTVNEPSGTYTATSRPPLSWSFFSQDGLPQTAYRYWIYTDNQYTASGFVPGSSAATFSSGTIYSTATRTVLPALVNETYRVYVQVAQTSNGQLQWSLISGSNVFKDYVLNITPPNAPAITATADSTFARISLAITGTGGANSVQDVYEVVKSYDGGLTWEGVRGDLGAYVLNVGGARVWFDYETGNGQSVTYRARTITDDTAGNHLVGAWSSNSSTVSWSSTSTWLKIPGRPDLNRVIVVQSFGDEVYAKPTGTFQGLGSGEAVVVSGVPRQLPDGAFILFTSTTAERDSLKELYETGEPWLVHASSRSTDWTGRNRYLQVGAMTTRRPFRVAVADERYLELSYTEIDVPSVVAYPVAFGVNTWQDIYDDYATFTALSAAFSTYGAIRG